MNKLEAAEILATYTSVTARRCGRRQITKDFIEEVRTEALSSTGQIRLAAEACPHWTTIRAAGRRQNRRP